MTILAFTPHGWCGLCVVAETEHAHEIIHCDSWQVGELVGIEGSTKTAEDYAARKGRDKERRVSDADYQGARDRIREAALIHDVTAAVIEIPKNPKALYYTKLSEAVKAECEELGIACRYYLITWRKLCDIRNAVREAIRNDWGTVSADRIAYDAQLMPAALLHQMLTYPEQYEPHRLETGVSPHITDPNAEKPERKPRKRSREIEQIEWHPRVDEATGTVPEPAEEPIVEPEPITDWRDLPGVREVPAVSDAPKSVAEIIQSSKGKACAGIDSGSHYIGFAVVQGDDTPVALRYLETIEIGIEVPLPKPKIRQYAGGATKTITHRRTFDSQNVVDTADRIVAKLVELGVPRLVIEHVDYAHFSKDTSVESAASIATSLLRNMWFGVTLYERATAAGIECSRIAHISWQSRVVGRVRRGSSDDRTVGEVLSGQVMNWPGRTNVHERDAIGVAISGVIPEREREHAKKTRAPKEATDRTTKVKGARANKAEKPLQGCTCKLSERNEVFSRRHNHDEDCPLFGATKRPARAYLPKKKQIPIEEVRDMLQRKAITATEFAEYVAKWWPESES